MKATIDVNIRRQPNLGAKVIRKAKKGEMFSYLNQQQMDERGVIWYKLGMSDGTQAWMTSGYSELVWANGENAGRDAGGNVVLSETDDGTPVRSGPCASNRSLAVIPPHGTAAYLGQCERDEKGVKWFKVSYNGVVGWASNNSCSLANR